MTNLNNNNRPNPICWICNPWHPTALCRSPCRNCARTGHKKINCNLTKQIDPLCTCMFCPTHGKKINTKPSEKMEPKQPNQSTDDQAMVTEEAEKSNDNHQLAIDKLTFALNTIEMEADEESDQTVKQKLEKHAAATKLQLAQVLTKEGQVASWDGVLLSSDLGDLGGCVPNAGQCINHEST
uniref:CCHC-type domain-containing protein n=1 Tax=Romanomermis culicivorax TaxID=13658 RepID=A0A915IZV1_ROMCU